MLVITSLYFGKFGHSSSVKRLTVDLRFKLPSSPEYPFLISTSIILIRSPSLYSFKSLMFSVQKTTLIEPVSSAIVKLQS